MIEVSNTSNENNSAQEQHEMPTSLPILTPKNLPEGEQLIKDYGNDLILMGDHIIFKHPDGLKPGAEAFLKAIEAATQGIDQSSAAKKNEALARALT